MDSHSTGGNGPNTELLTPDDIRRVVVVGAGTMGHGIAQVFAQHGREVALVDADERALSAAMERIRANLGLLLEFEMLTPAEAAATPGRIRPTTDLAGAAAGADFAVESVMENLPAKQEVFRDLDGHAPPHAILASNTSSLPITLIAGVTRRPEQVVGTHFVNPPYVIPMVEVTKGERTSDQTVALTRALMSAVGKKPVVILKDTAGLVGARLQSALVRECFHVVEEGLATAEDVDALVKYSHGFRLSTMGPFESWDMVGLDVILGAARFIFPKLAASPEPSALLQQKVAAGALGVKAGRGMHDWPTEKREAWLRHKHRELLRGVRQQQLAEEALRAAVASGADFER